MRDLVTGGGLLWLRGIWRFLRIALLSLTAAFFCAPWSAFSQTAVLADGPSPRNLEIIANLQGPTAPTITSALLRDIFALELPAWPNGTRVRVFAFASDSELQAVFVERYMHVFQYQLQRSWDRNSFSGVASQPVVVLSDAQMARAVRATPGGIGYVDAAYLSIPGNRDGLRILKVTP